ncbi:MAG: exodeoxyribonuclease V subunit alpha [Bacteroidales bacterium]|nr:exodeoxyribonuclease V subunit alpha [Bacteroidales bacterium]
MPQPKYNHHRIFAAHFTGCEALAYALSSRLAEGHICIDIEGYAKEIPAILEEESAKESFTKEDAKFWGSPEAFMNQCEDGEFVTTDPEVLKPFIIHNGKAYLQRYFWYESMIIDRIRGLDDRLRIITGGPGSGKTYSVATTLEERFSNNPNLKVALAAPTGKAGVRMEEAIREHVRRHHDRISEQVSKKLSALKGETLHRLLGFIPDSVFFRHDGKNPLPYQVVIIDECSMIDGAMMAKLLDAIHPESMLYLIGDRNQLASVEAGSVFGDLCMAENSVPLNGKITTLEGSRRFSTDKGIGRLSSEVIGGSIADLKAYEGDEQVSIDTTFSDDQFYTYAALYEDYIREPDTRTALLKMNRVRFLCTTREHVQETNERISRHLARRIEDFNPRKGAFYHNQPIIITRNDYRLGIYNGDVGIIRKIVNERNEGVFYAFFETAGGEPRKIQAAFLSHYDTVFAMTIHKSQGSQFEKVVVILPADRGVKLLTRELLYTGITRAMKNVLLQTTEETLHNCLERKVERASGLEKRLNQ